MKAEGMRMEAGLHSLFQTHQEEMKAHRDATENAAKLAAESKLTNVDGIIEIILERDRLQPPPPPSSCSDSRCALKARDQSRYQRRQS
ncbi:hypothetical protein N9L68_08640 [bacterium]|nr:hypothetical protein [bacterium]